VPAELYPVLERFSHNLMRKFIHFPIEKLKSLRDGTGLNPTEIAFLKRLFLANGAQPPRSLRARPAAERGAEPGAEHSSDA
jgi:hypothetical protein